MLDKALYRQAFEQYRRWNEAEEAERIRNAGRLSPQEAQDWLLFFLRGVAEQARDARARRLQDLREGGANA